jgi:hypothetical protein
MAFPILAFIFGLLLYAAASGLFAMTWEGMASWLWWAALVPLALCHGVSGFIATTTAAGALASQTRTVLVCALVSAATTLLTLLVAIWCASAMPLSLSHDLAAAFVLTSLLGGFAGLVVAWRMSHRSLVRPPQVPEN